jgi:transcriptional regulator with XRE-family HTH domain
VRGLTLETASEAAGVHPGHLGSIERGVVNVTLGVLVALAKTLRVELSDFFQESVTPEVRNPRSRSSTPPVRRTAAPKPKKRRRP